MASCSIDVYVKLPSGKAVSQQHWPNDSVRTITQKLADNESIPEQRIRLKYQGKTLDKGKTIGYLGIRAETILKVEVLVPKDTNVTIQLPDGSTEEILLQSTDTVTHLRQRIHDKCDIDTGLQILKVNKHTVTQVNDLLCDVGITDQCTVVVEKRNPVQNTAPGDEEEEVVDEELKQDLLNTFASDGRNVEVVFCFDTTGSMYSCLQQVRNKLRESCTRLLRDIPNIRIGLMANGDYCDAEKYVVRYEDLTTDVDRLVNFANTVPATGGGGNGGEAYEWALRKAQQMDWSEDSAKAFVLIGDEPPHVPEFTDQDLFWKDEVDVLSGMDIKVYGVQALARHHERAFYEEIAERSNGFYLQLKDFNLITDMFLAVCYREADDGQLDAFVEEVEKEGRMTENTKLFLDKLEDKTEVKPKTESELSKETKAKDDLHQHLPWWNPPRLSKNGRPEYTYDAEIDFWKRTQAPSNSYVSPRSSYSTSYNTPTKKMSKLQRVLSIFKRNK